MSHVKKDGKERIKLAKRPQIHDYQKQLGRIGLRSATGSCGRDGTIGGSINKLSRFQRQQQERFEEAQKQQEEAQSRGGSTKSGRNQETRI